MPAATEHSITTMAIRQLSMHTMQITEQQISGSKPLSISHTILISIPDHIRIFMLVSIASVSQFLYSALQLVLMQTLLTLLRLSQLRMLRFGQMVQPKVSHQKLHFLILHLMHSIRQQVRSQLILQQMQYTSMMLKHRCLLVRRFTTTSQHSSAAQQMLQFRDKVQPTLQWYSQQMQAETLLASDISPHGTSQVMLAVLHGITTSSAQPVQVTQLKPSLMNTSLFTMQIRAQQNAG